MIHIEKLLDKCESMTLLCTRTATYWSYVKMGFNIPLVFTSSAMCIINSISTDANTVKIPNIVVNAISVLIMSLSNSIKSSEKFELFKKLSQQFMMLSQELEALEGDEPNLKEILNIANLKYENLIQDCSFEDIPQKNKTNVAKLFGDANRYLPIQLNGTTGNNINIRTVIKRNTPPEVLSKGASLITIEKKIDIESGEIY
tara:strand:+ start:4377 stop:4979 length:603 start_codon:yes stop_codon:yes gene_type:complete